MPKVTIWVRVEDMERWDSIKNKPEWLHQSLATLPYYKPGMGYYHEKPQKHDIVIDPVVEAVDDDPLLLNVSLTDNKRHERGVSFESLVYRLESDGVVYDANDEPVDAKVRNGKIVELL